MDLYRAFLAIIISFVILVGYQYFFVKPAVQQQAASIEHVQTQQPQATDKVTAVQPSPSATTLPATIPVDPEAREITVDTPLYTAIIHEQGGGIKSFVLKNYRTEFALDSGPMELVNSTTPQDLPLLFTLDNAQGAVLPVFKAAQEHLTLEDGESEQRLEMVASLADGTRITRSMVFHSDTYLIEMSYQVENTTSNTLQVSPALSMLNNKTFTEAKGKAVRQFLFAGPAAFVNGKLVETKIKKLADGPVSLQGDVSWAGFVDNYFMATVIPPTGNSHVVTHQVVGEKVRTVISEGIQSLPPQGGVAFSYTSYFGPKKLKILKEAGGNLSKAVNFGWFDILAKPMLWLLNFFYEYVNNYGIAIILVTVLIKGCFWPITQKGMKSMKNMQKLQPKMAKLREKYKNDPTKMNQEVMAMYKTYKVNPLGGCLPMVIQIPFFFALYRVLMAAIELRHAPFMLWINDLSAPDRLWVGFDIPYLHGLPVLTLLMGASMFLQQKMTPTTADPTQARIMQFLPVIFTFMFLNFASGLVLYWFVNNLLSILQQQLINRQSKA